MLVKNKKATIKLKNCLVSKQEKAEPVEKLITIDAETARKKLIEKDFCGVGGKMAMNRLYGFSNLTGLRELKSTVGAARFINEHISKQKFAVVGMLIWEKLEIFIINDFVDISDKENNVKVDFAYKLFEDKINIPHQDECELFWDGVLTQAESISDINIGRAFGSRFEKVRSFILQMEIPFA